LEDPNWIVGFVTWSATDVLKLRNVGQLVCDCHADFIAIDSQTNDELALCNSHRNDLTLVVKGGVPQIGDPEVMAKFSHIRTVGATLDGRPKSIHQDLAKRIHLCQLKEAGLEVEALPKRRLFARGQ
jgi:hypothetical protein